jgi:hypothetical protein
MKLQVGVRIGFVGTLDHIQHLHGVGVGFLPNQLQLFLLECLSCVERGHAAGFIQWPAPWFLD